MSKLRGFQRAGKVCVTISTAAATWLLCRRSRRAQGAPNDSRMILVSPSRGSGARDARGKWLGWLGVRMQSGLSRKLWRAVAMANSHDQRQWGLWQQGSSRTRGPGFNRAWVEMVGSGSIQQVPSAWLLLEAHQRHVDPCCVLSGTSTLGKQSCLNLSVP